MLSNLTISWRRYLLLFIECHHVEWCRKPKPAIYESKQCIFNCFISDGTYHPLVSIKHAAHKSCHSFQIQWRLYIHNQVKPRHDDPVITKFNHNKYFITANSPQHDDSLITKFSTRWWIFHTRYSSNHLKSYFFCILIQLSLNMDQSYKMSKLISRLGTPPWT